MSMYLYDKSIVSRLRKITGDDRVHIIPPEDSISFFAQFDKDKVQFPAVVLSRRSVNLQDYQNQVVKLKGHTVRLDDDNIVVKAKMINLRIDWDLDIFAVDRYSCDEIVRELVFYFITYPRFEVEVPYSLNIDQNFDVFLSNEIQDNSDLIEFPNRGEYFRETISLYTENAHFFSAQRQYPVFVKYEHELVTGDEIKNNFNKGDE